ncbi:hypothetical protein A2U01_0105291, partial [Trifolium medium]|nr:hypothetical protein [Trifolium medium]
ICKIRPVFVAFWWCLGLRSVVFSEPP